MNLCLEEQQKMNMNLEDLVLGKLMFQDNQE